MGSRVQRPELTREQETVCAKVRVIDDSDRLLDRLAEIDPSVYRGLLADLALPSTTLSDLNDHEIAIRDVVLAIALLTDGCVMPRCQSNEGAVYFLMLGPGGGALPGFVLRPGRADPHAPAEVRRLSGLHGGCRRRCWPASPSPN